jgi:pimeloyl-ACP methyl ester carboxylesterase
VAGRWSRRWFDPFVAAGYTVWFVTRRRGMPQGHTVADMADDYARVISEDLGGRVDLVVGESFGGMIAQYLAARHGARCGRVAVVIAAAEVSAWGREVDARLADALARDDTAGVGSAFAEYALPGERSGRVRRLVGRWIGPSLLSGKHFPPGDLLVETEAEMAFDARPVLPGIGVPVVLLCGDSDRFFPREVVEETARLIPDCTLIWYEGKGHLKVGASRRVPLDVLAFVDGR